MKKWIFITVSVIIMLLIVLNFYNAQGAWNTLHDDLKQESGFSQILEKGAEMQKETNPPVMTSFLITPLCMSSTDNIGINGLTHSFLVDGGLQKASNPIVCKRDVDNTGLHVWRVKLAAQGIFKDVRVRKNSANSVNISNVVINQSECEFIVASETPFQRESTTLIIYIYNSYITWDIEAGLFSRVPGPLPD